MNQPRRVIPLPVWVAIALLAMISVVQGIRNAGRHSMDLRGFHNAIRLMFDGVNVYRLNLEGTLPARLAELPGDPEGWATCDYFPSAYLPVLPLATLPWPWARAIWLSVNVAASAGVWWLLAGFAGKPRPPPDALAFAVLVWLMGTPFRVSLGLGQNSIFALALVLASLRASNARQPALAGLLLALGLAKYALVWPFVLFCFVLDGRWRALAWAGGLHLLIHLWLCWWMRAHPLLVLVDVLRDNTRVFNYDVFFTLWMPGRRLATLFPAWAWGRPVLGVLPVLLTLAWLVRLWVRGHAREHPLAWLAVLSLFSVVALTPKIYSFVGLAAPLLLVAHPGGLPMAAEFRWRIAALIVYLTVVHRLVEALLVDRAAPWVIPEFFFNVAILFLCLDFARWFSGLNRSARAAPASPT